MQIKKRYVVIAVVLLLGLTSFTFASPREVEKQKPAKGVSERVANDKKENRSYAEALEAVEAAEENPTLDTVETARNEIRNADDATADQITQLQNRVNVVEETIDVAALVTEVETLAEVKETRETAKEKYPNAETEVNKLDEGEVKNNLTKRLEKVLRLLNDTNAPEITGVTNGSIVNKSENIYVSDEFLYNVKITGPNSKGEVVTKEFNTEDFIANENNDAYTMKYKANYEGEWTVVATDKVGNTKTETFTIDKTAAKKNAVNANVNGYKNNVTEQYATNGNTVTAYISINEELKYNPTFTFYANGKDIKVIAKEDVVARPSSNANYPYIYEVKLTIDENLVAEDGDLTFTVTDIVDKAGNKTADITKVSNGKVVKLDRTPNRVTFTTIATDNNVVEGNKYYVTNGNTVTFRMGVREKFSENPVVTIGGKEVTLEYVKYFAQPNHHEYRGTLKLDDTLVDGNLDITISNLTDEVGNKGFYYQTNGKKVLETITKTETTNGKSLVYDKTAPTRVYSTLRVNKTEYNQNGIKYYYVKNGDSFEFAISLNERLAETPVVTIGGRTVEMKLNEKVLANENKVLYEGTFKIAKDEKDLTEGQLEIKVSNVKDILGNESTIATVIDQTITSNFRTVVYDRTAPIFSTEAGYNEDGFNPYVKVNEANDVLFKVYRKGTEKPIHEFDSTTAGKSFKIGWHGGGVYTIVAADKAGNEASKEIEVYHTIDSLEDLETALKNGGKAVLTENLTINELVEIPEGVELEIDLQGNDIKLVHQDGETGKLINNKGKLTVKNGSITSDEATAKTLINNESGAELVFDNIKYTDNAATNASSIVSKGKLTITNSKINGLATTNGNTLFSINGDFTLKNTEIKANSVKGYVANIWSGNVTVDDSNLDAERGGLAILGGTVKINNTNIDAAVGGNNYRALYITDNQEGNDINVTVNNGKFVGYRDCVYVQHNDLANVKVTINGGEYDLNKGNRNGNLFNIVPKANAEKEFDVKIKGGTYKYEPLGNVKDYLASGFRINAEGKVVKENAISTKAEMVEAIANGGKFELDIDLTLTDEPLVIKKGTEVEIDLNGKTITGRSTNASASKLITVNEGATLKLTGNGTIDFTAGKPDTNWGGEGQLPFPGYSSNTISNIGKLIIDGPTIINNTAKGGASYVIDNYQGSELIVKSGKIHQTGGDQALRIFANSNTLTTSLTIEGGEIIGRRALWIQLPNSDATRAPKVNVNIKGGTLRSNDTGEGGYNLAIYSYSYGESANNVNVNISGGEFFGHVAFGGGSKNGRENVTVTGGIFHNSIGRYLANDGWEDITISE